MLDTACAKVALGQSTVPAAVEDRSKRRDRIAAEVAALEREAAAGAAHAERLAELRALQQQLAGEIEALTRDDLAAVAERYLLPRRSVTGLLRKAA